MKRLTTLGPSLIVAFTVLAIASSTAWAYTEFRPLPEGVLFSFESEVEKPKLDTLGGKNILCLHLSAKGKFTSDRLGWILEAMFTGCEEPSLKIKCTDLSSGITGVLFVNGEFHIRHLLPESNGVTFVLLPGLIHFSCLGILFVLSGCVASTDVLTKQNGESVVNKKLTSSYTTFLQERGDQKITSIDTDSSLGMEECILKMKQEAGSSESAGLLTLGSFTLEATEIMLH